jgi:hypothetical protein
VASAEVVVADRRSTSSSRLRMWNCCTWAKSPNETLQQTEN